MDPKNKLKLKECRRKNDWTEKMGTEYQQTKKMVYFKSAISIINIKCK